MGGTIAAVLLVAHVPYPAVYRQIPNQITVARLVLAFVFFLVLNQYRFPHYARWALLVAIALFVIAAISDWLDGYLARKWKVESTFGRIMDPFCDKVLVIGAFIYLSGPRFVDPQHVEPPTLLGNIIPGNVASGVYPWMVALILARELLVTGIRDELESTGVRFGANFSGKLKLVFQVVAIPLILLIVWLDPRSGVSAIPGLALIRDILVYLTVAVTMLSGWPYVRSAMRSVKEKSS